MNGITDFMREIQSEKIAVLGFGISNKALLRFLENSGARNVYLFDLSADQAKTEEAKQLKAKGAIKDYRFGEDYLDELPDGGFDIIFRSPIMRPDEEHIARAVRNGARLTSEMEIFMEYCPCPIYAITGSDGKTTTTTLTSLILSEHYRGTDVKIWLGGNIGTPLIDKLSEIKPDDRAVLELSSFQLMHMDVSADVSAITNITPNHLNVHKNYEEYIDCKRAIFGKKVHPVFPGAETGKRPQKRVVLNAGNPVTAKIAEDLAANGWKVGDEDIIVDVFTAKKSREIAEKLPHNGATAFLTESVTDGSDQTGSPKIAFTKFCEGCGACDGKNFEFDRGDLLLPGLHNAENLMTAALIVRHEVNGNDVLAVARTFGGVEHRLEKVRELDGVTYVNSSIDSSPERTINALSVFPKRNLVLIAGGKDKNLDFGPIGAAITAKVKVLILTGQTADKIRASVESAPGSDSVRIIRADNYPDAVRLARDNAVPGDIVLLSPAGTSFDMFKNFEERGNYFKKLVSEL